MKRSQPATVMAAYNKLNGTYCCENETLLEQTVREEWGFEGLFVSDWGALNDPVDSFRNGLDVEMPGVSKGSDELVLEALERGDFPQERLDAAAERIVALGLHHKSITPAPFDVDAHLALAQRAAEESAVLLKNGGALPMKQGASLAVIGGFARHPRYQGAGSSRVNPIALDDLCGALDALGIAYNYAEGYDAKGGTTLELLDQARQAAQGKDLVVVVVGLPDDYESEGYDRDNLELSQGHNRLIEAVAAVNPNTAVVLQCGGCVTMPWLARVNAVLLTYLSGCQGGKATANLLTGAVNPSGKLAETFPLSLEDTPCWPYYHKGGKVCQYRESIFTGYRYYDTAEKPVLFPFGHGLSYTTFAYRGLTIEQDGERVKVGCTVANTGAVSGKETVQLYVSHKNPGIFKAAQELKGFHKLALRPGEEKRVEFTLDREDFAFYNVACHGWHVEGGAYELRLSTSSRDIRLAGAVTLAGDAGPVPDYRETAPAYYDPARLGDIPQKQFEALLGCPVPAETVEHWPYTRNVTLGVLQKDPQAFAALQPLLAGRGQEPAAGQDENDVRQAQTAMLESPIRSIAMTGMGKRDIAALLERINGARGQA